MTSTELVSDLHRAGGERERRNVRSAGIKKRGKGRGREKALLSSKSDWAG